MTLAEADKARDDIHRGLCHIVNGHCYNADTTTAQAARIIQRVVKRYGTSRLRDGGYDDETALIRSLLADLNSQENSTHTAQIGLTTWISDLNNANSTFEQLMTERRNEASASLDYTTRDVRKEITPLYRQITQAVETFAVLGVDPQFAEFITKLNSEIAYKR